MKTIKFLEELKLKVTEQTLNTDFDSKEFQSLAQINATIEWHTKRLKHEKPE